MASPIISPTDERQVAFWIDGYYMHSPQRDHQRAFIMAQRELLANFQRHIAAIESMSFARWRQLTECCIEEDTTNV